MYLRTFWGVWCVARWKSLVSPLFTPTPLTLTGRASCGVAPLWRGDTFISFHISHYLAGLTVSDFDLSL